jgi:hypothetical protein
MLNSLNIGLDVGNIDIKYVYPPLDYGIDIIIYIDLAGKGLAKKAYTDIFNIIFEHNQTLVNLTLDLQPGIDQNEVLSQIKSLDILVRINVEAELNVKANIGVGNFVMNVPFGVILYNLEVNITKGNVFYEFYNCFVVGSIKGFSNWGDFIFHVIDVQYSQESEINLGNFNGVINIKITQNQIMDANLTGIVTTFKGDINVSYEDNSPNTGAFLSFHNHTTGWVGIENSWFGFNDPIFLGEFGYIFSSFDYPAPNNYNLSFYKASDFGKYSVNLLST